MTQKERWCVEIWGTERGRGRKVSRVKNEWDWGSRSTGSQGQREFQVQDFGRGVGLWDGKFVVVQLVGRGSRNVKHRWDQGILGEEVGSIVKTHGDFPPYQNITCPREISWLFHDKYPFLPFHRDDTLYTQSNPIEIRLCGPVPRLKYRKYLFLLRVIIILHIVIMRSTVNCYSSLNVTDAATVAEKLKRVALRDSAK